MPNVFGLSEAQTSSIISLAGVLSIAGMFAAGAWMARSGPTTVHASGTIIRTVGLLGLAILGLVGSVGPLIVFLFAQILYISRPFGRLPQPAVGVRFSPISPGQTTGWIGGAAAIGSFIGSLLGGWLADTVGFNAINWMGAIAVGLAVLLYVFSLLPAERKKLAADAA